MRNFKLTIEYDGTNYFGWQRQADDKRFPTVQGAMEKALQRLFGKKISIVASGRTDTGVHALGQVASFKVDTEIPSKNILRALNTYLPGDILVKDIEEVPLSFNARFNAKKKWYRYTIIQVNSVLDRHYSAYCPYRLNLRLMRQAGKKMEYKVNISKNGKFIYIDVIGKGFLYKMVRKIAGSLIDAGRGKKGANIQTAPAKGLTLIKVYY